MKSVTRRGSASIKTVLMTTAACAIALGGLTTAAQAQDEAAAAPAEDTQVVIVTGIRKGLQDSLTIKKKNTSIVEAVSAEDIGKLPDASIAESLARLPAWRRSASAAGRRPSPFAGFPAISRPRC